MKILKIHKILFRVLSFLVIILFFLQSLSTIASRAIFTTEFDGDFDIVFLTEIIVILSIIILTLLVAVILLLIKKNLSISIIFALIFLVVGTLVRNVVAVVYALQEETLGIETYANKITTTNLVSSIMIGTVSIIIYLGFAYGLFRELRIARKEEKLEEEKKKLES